MCVCVVVIVGWLETFYLATNVPNRIVQVSYVHGDGMAMAQLTLVAHTEWTPLPPPTHTHLPLCLGLYHLFRNAEGTPRTPDHKDTDFMCGGVAQGTHSALNTIAAFSERGAAMCDVDPVWQSPDLSRNCLFKVTSPAVLAKGRAYFGCDTLNGVELENQPTAGGCSLIGSHWEQRILASDLMASTSDGSGTVVISPMTLAIFEDSGWYV